MHSFIHSFIPPLIGAGQYSNSWSHSSPASTLLRVAPRSAASRACLCVRVPWCDPILWNECPCAIQIFQKVVRKIFTAFSQTTIEPPRFLSSVPLTYFGSKRLLTLAFQGLYTRSSFCCLSVCQSFCFRGRERVCVESVIRRTIAIASLLCAAILFTAQVSSCFRNIAYLPVYTFQPAL